MSRKPTNDPCCRPEDVACLRCGCRVCGNKDGTYKCRPTRCGACLKPDGSFIAWPGYKAEGGSVSEAWGRTIARARRGDEEAIKAVCDELAVRLGLRRG